MSTCYTIPIHHPVKPHVEGARMDMVGNNIIFFKVQGYLAIPRSSISTSFFLCSVETVARRQVTDTALNILGSQKENEEIVGSQAKLGSSQCLFSPLPL